MKILNELERTLKICIKKKELKGFFIQIKGRFQRSQRKSFAFKRFGKISFNKIDSNLKVHYDQLYSKFGISGMKLIFSY